MIEDCYVGRREGESGQGRESYRVKVGGSWKRKVFVIAYMNGILALLYHHISQLLKSNHPRISNIVISLSLLVSDVVLALEWATRQVFHICKVERHEHEHEHEFENKSKLPALDIFICTADPQKEPPMNVVDTALSVMAYDYPTQKLSIYLSDDAASHLTLFAFNEAAKFATHWLPFCKQNNLLDRSPPQFFTSNHHLSTTRHAQHIKMMYERMKFKVEEKGRNIEISSEHVEAFTRQNHPPVIQVLLQSERDRDRDITGQHMPNLIYVSRGKSVTSPHHFKAGALNALLRVSATMTNAPLILTLDCDTFSNNPKTPLLVLPYLLDPHTHTHSLELAYVQFPQRFRNLNKNDTYACAYKVMFDINATGMDGLSGPNYVGTGCFFNRRALFGGPSSFVEPEIPQLKPDHVVNKPITCESIMDLAHHVANSNYHYHWGSKIGFKYGSVVEDFFTGYRLQCEGWKSILCNPGRAAFMGDTPILLDDALNQYRRWMVGLLQVFFSRFNPFLFGTRSMGLLMGLAYAHYTLWAFLCIPLTIYAFLPQLALLNGHSIFPKVSESSCFVLYVLLFFGAYGLDFVDFGIESGLWVRRWWNDQRMWMIRGVSSSLFGWVEFCLKSLRIWPHCFVLTNKVLDHQVKKRYDEGLFEFGVASPMLVPLTTAAIINLAACMRFFTAILRGHSLELEGLLLQMLLSTFIATNCVPIYEAMFLRIDKGRIPVKITIISASLAWALYTSAASLIITSTTTT